MSGRYERVNAQDDEDDVQLRTSARPSPHSLPNSPPPSFRSRASSPTSRHRRVEDPTLADAFDADDSDDDEEPDDRQRLVRQNSDPVQPTSSQPQSSTDSSGASTPSSRPQAPGPRTTTATATSSNRIIGSGIQSDGVFSNLTAKPERSASEKEEQPPTYEQAAADAAPPYWETTILAPGLGGPDEVYIDGMPVGSVFSFVWNGMISMSFQLVGFLLTYLLHSTHAAKNGSRAGLGITLIQYGFYMKGTGGSGAGGMGDGQGMGGGDGNGYASPQDPNSHDFDPGSVQANGGGGDAGGESGGVSEIGSSEWVAYILMIVGWFILIRAVSDYLKARRHEQLVLQSPDRGLGVAIIAEGESVERVV